MSVPPAPPRKNKHLSAANGSGHQAAARLRSSPGLLEHDQYAATEKEKEQREALSPRALLEEMPETIIGENVVVKGELKFETLLRVNGLCTGKLISTGNLIIGPSGKVIGNIEHMGSVLVDGKVEGNITVDTVCLRNRAQVFGNITCKSITVDPEVTISGQLNIHSQAPKRIDSDGKEVTDSEADIAAQTKQAEEVKKKKKEEEEKNKALEEALKAESAANLKKQQDAEKEAALLAALEKQKLADQEASKAALLGLQISEEEKEKEEKERAEAARKQEEIEQQEKDAAALAAKKKEEKEEQEEQERQKAAAAAKALSDETEARSLQKKKEEQEEEEAKVKAEAEAFAAKLQAEQNAKAEEEAGALQNDLEE